MVDKMESKWADPNPGGSLLVACVLIATGALFSGFVRSTCGSLVMVNSIAIGVTLLVMAIISFRKGDLVGGTLNLVFGTSALYHPLLHPCMRIDTPHAQRAYAKLG